MNWLKVCKQVTSYLVHFVIDAFNYRAYKFVGFHAEFLQSITLPSFVSTHPNSTKVKND